MGEEDDEEDEEDVSRWLRNSEDVGRDDDSTAAGIGVGDDPALA